MAALRNHRAEGGITTRHTSGGSSTTSTDCQINVGARSHGMVRVVIRSAATATAARNLGTSAAAAATTDN
jgi:hypothetical protein